MTLYRHHVSPFSRTPAIGAEYVRAPELALVPRSCATGHSEVTELKYQVIYSILVCGGL